ncbi:hypothetical protein QBC39DRAFT_33959 [Podospora conica]|nr:hypothetical protein QBC39DRAFT_33959 [Schizothecium conicum]
MAVTFTPQPWCFTEFFWHTSHQGANTYYLPWGTRTGYLPWTTRLSATPSSTGLLPRMLTGHESNTILSVKTVVVVDTTGADPPAPTPPPTTLLRVRQNSQQTGTEPHECYPENVDRVASSGGCPSGWTYAITDNPTWTCCPFAYTIARTRTINRSTFINTTRCVSTFGLGTEKYRPMITIIKEIDTWGQLSDMTGTSTFGANLDVWASTLIPLYAEAIPYSVLAPPGGAGTTPGAAGPQETRPPGAVPTGPPDVEASSSFSPGAAAGIAIGAIILLAVAGYYLWRCLRGRKMAAAGRAPRNLEAGGVAGPRMADCDDKEVVPAATAASAKPPPYELDISGPTTAAPPVVEADHGLKVQIPGEAGFAAASVPELGGRAVEREHPSNEGHSGPPRVPAPWLDANPGPSRSGAVSPEMGAREAVPMNAGEMSPATTFAMSSDSRPTSILPEGGGDWSNTVRVSYLQRELKNIRIERERLRRMEQLDAREAELERLVLEEMATLKEGEKGGA